MALHLWREGYETARALGMTPGEIFAIPASHLAARDATGRAAAERALEQLMVRAGPTKASMLQDLQRSRRTEVDVINGGVAAAARSVGREAPLNAEVTRIVHDIEDGAFRAGPDAFRRLAAVSTHVVAK